MKASLLYKRLCVSFILLLSLFFILPANAIPKEIILIRHADKLIQPNPGPFLSPLGRQRADKFSDYYLSHINTSGVIDNYTFNEPDYIITTAHTAQSNRELETVMPLVTEFAVRHPKTGQPVLLSDVYRHGEGLAGLYQDLLKSSKFNGKTILICWHHGEIPELLDGLGTSPHQTKLADEDYDTVYHILFNPITGNTTLIVLPNQYPVE